MTLDEAIKHAEEVAEEKDMQAGFDTDYSCYQMSDTERNQCKQCAKEHRQLVGWLKELKQLREQEFYVTTRKLSDDELKHLEEQMKEARWQLISVKQDHCDDAISRKAAIDAMIKIEQDDIDSYGCSIPEGFNSDPAVEALNNLPSVIPQPKKGYISIDDVMSVFDDFMCGEVDEDVTDTFLEMLKDKAESEE